MFNSRTEARETYAALSQKKQDALTIGKSVVIVKMRRNPFTPTARRRRRAAIKALRNGENKQPRTKGRTRVKKVLVPRET